MVDINNLTAGYSGKPVLTDITLPFPAGKVTAVLGPNGCGKSTLLKTIAGILPIQKGSIWVDGTDLSGLDPKLRARTVTYLAQNRPVPQMTVMQLTLHGRFPYLSYPRRYRREDVLIAENCLKQLGLWELKDAQLATLSGGQRQKVYLAMALAQDTPVVLMDEPTTFLDVGHQLQTLADAKDLARQGKTVVLVLHDLTLAMEHADYLVVMHNGRIRQTGTPEEIWKTGCLNEVFRVNVHRFATENGTKYYCQLQSDSR